MKEDQGKDLFLLVASTKVGEAVGSIRDLTILVIVKSLFTRKKPLTPKIRFSKTPLSTLASLRRSVNLLDIELNPLKMSPPALWPVGWEGADAIIVT